MFDLIFDFLMIDYWGSRMFSSAWIKYILTRYYFCPVFYFFLMQGKFKLDSNENLFHSPGNNSKMLLVDWQLWININITWNFQTTKRINSIQINININFNDNFCVHYYHNEFMKMYVFACFYLIWIFPKG